ncbi:MAG: penicillin-binding protein activator [Bdellovibrionales bacterium]
MAAKFRPFLALALIPLILGACQTGGGYGNRAWDYSRTQSQSAEQPPSQISSATPQTGLSNLSNTAPATNQQNLPPVKIGLLLPLSGQHKALGEAMLNAAQIAVFDIGYDNFELVPKDTQATPQGAANAARSALKDGAQLILGPVFASSVSAVKPITSASGVNMIAFSTDWSLAQSNKSGGNTFIFGFLPFDQVERITGYAASTGTIKNIGVLSPNTSYGRAVTNAFDRTAPRYGLHTTARSNFNAGSNNLSPEISAFSRYAQRQGIQNAPAPFDAVLMPVGGRQAADISALLTQNGLPPSTVRRLGTGLMDDKSLAFQNSLEGTWFAAPSPRLRQSFEQKYLKTYNTPAPRLATLAYDATALAAVLAQRGLQSGGAPAFDRAAIMNPSGFFGIDGVFRFRPDGTVERGLAVLEFSRGQIRIIDDAPTTFQQTNY